MYSNSSGMVEIKSIGGNVVLGFDDIPEGSLVHRELMGEHYVKIPFSLETPIYFRIGDYLENEFGRFELTAPYRPKYNTQTSGFDYELQLNAHYLKWENKLCKYLPYSTSNEVSFHLTSTADVHLAMIVRNVNAIGEKDSTFKYNGKPFVYELKNFPVDKLTKAIYVQYNRIGIISALNAVADAFECEWWIEGNIIYFGRCEINSDEVDFTIDENVSDMSSSESQNEYATRIIAFGSTRNLPKDYRKDTTADITKDGIVQKRLMLPISGPHACHNGYLQDEDVRNEAEAVEAVFVDDTIYPRTMCKVSEVITYVSKKHDEETGEEITQTFYRLKDSSGLNFSTDYILEGETLHILFQSGSMNGMDFECKYSDSEKYYEVIVNDNYGRSLPDETLHPKEGDEFVLYGWDSTKIGNTGLIEQAEEELRLATVAKLADMKIDPNTYTCKMESDWYDEWMQVTNANHFTIGQKVKLNNIAYFQTGRSSRIIGYELKLDFLFDEPEYTVGESAKFSRTKDFQKQLESIKVNGVTYQGPVSVGFAGGSGDGSSGSGGSGVYLITTSDTTAPSDYNAYSASRTDKDFLRRNKADTAQKRITFLEESQHNEGIQIGESFVSGLVGIGGKINGQAEAELKSLTLRTWLEVPELRFNRTTVDIGLRMQSRGGGIIESVTPTSASAGICRLKLEDGEIGAVEDFDLCMGIWHDKTDINGNEETDSDDRKGNFTFGGFKTVYFQITSISGNDNNEFTYLLRSVADGGNGIHPFAGMHFAQRGNTSNTERQSFKYETTEYSAWLADVNTWEFQPSNYKEIRGKLDGFSLPAIDGNGNVYNKEFHGIGQVFGNAYIYGTLDTFERFGVTMSIDSSVGNIIAWGESTLVTCTVWRAFEDITNTVKKWTITRNSGDELEDEAWALKSKVRNFAGEIYISFNEEENDLGPNLATQFTITAIGDADQPLAQGLVTF